MSDSVFRCRLPFLDVTVGLVQGETGTLLIDAGTTLTEANAIRADVAELTGGVVTHIMLTHNHFDHILGSSAFSGATVYCAPEVAATITDRTQHLRADAISHGADPDDVATAVAALRAPGHAVRRADIDLGDKTVAVRHLGRGHTDHDVIAVVPATDRHVVFCGDLVEESGDPVIDEDSHQAEWPATLSRIVAAGGPDALYVPGHGAVVDAGFVDRQRRWLSTLM